VGTYACLYFKKQNLCFYRKKSKLNKERQIKRLDITQVIFKTSDNPYKKQIKKIAVLNLQLNKY
jgi:hypothetical protein